MSARKQALKDMAKDIKVEITYYYGYPEIWTVGVSTIDTKKNRKLNRLILK